MMPILLLVAVLLAAPAPSSLSPASCPGGAVPFCGQSWPAETTTLRCYGGRGRQQPLALGPLACLRKLRELSLVSGEIEFVQFLELGSLDPLARLQHLQSLSLGETSASDLTPLVGLGQLERLTLHASRVQDLRPLALLVRLVELDLSSTRVTDLKPLASLTRLARLDLRCTRVVDLTPLASLQSLTWLDLSATPVTDLTPLAGLAHLQWLGLRADSPVAPAQVRALRQRLPDLVVGDGGRCCAVP